MIYFLRPQGKILYFTKPLPSPAPVFQSMYNGLSSLLTYLSDPLVTMLYTYELLRWAGDTDWPPTVLFPTFLSSSMQYTSATPMPLSR